MDAVRILWHVRVLEVLLLSKLFRSTAGGQDHVLSAAPQGSALHSRLLPVLRLWQGWAAVKALASVVEQMVLAVWWWSTSALLLVGSGVAPHPNEKKIDPLL